MITLREFLKTIKGQHYRVYQPNRDCLIFESYFTTHSPYYFDFAKEHLFEHKKSYWDDNSYCRGVYTDSYKDVAYDEETADFLDHFGQMEVFAVECSSFLPMSMSRGEDGQLKFDYLTEESMPNREYIPCFNIFIADYDEEHRWECNYCFHGLLKKDETDKNGCSWFPDPKDRECKQCWRFLENKSKGEK